MSVLNCGTAQLTAEFTTIESEVPHKAARRYPGSVTILAQVDTAQTPLLLPEAVRTRKGFLHDQVLFEKL